MEKGDKAMDDMDTYHQIVVFTRSLSDDEDVIRSVHIDQCSPQELAQQLAKELQAAYDHIDVAPAGSFQVVSIIRNGAPCPIVL